MEKTPPKPRRRRLRAARTWAKGQAAAVNPIDGLCGVAMLKIAMELKKRGSVPVDEVIDSVLSTMAIDPAAFRKYVASQGGVLQRLQQMRRGHRP